MHSKVLVCKLFNGTNSYWLSASYHDSGQFGTEAVTAAKVVNTAGGIFETEMYSIAFNVNDNLSVSYGKATDTYDAQSNVKGGTEIADVEVDTKSSKRLTYGFYVLMHKD